MSFCFLYYVLFVLSCVHEFCCSCVGKVRVWGGEDSFVQNNLEINSDIKSALDRPPPPVHKNKIFLIVTTKEVFRIRILMGSALIWLSWIRIRIQ
jgi:hypothetical protein